MATYLSQKIPCKFTCELCYYFTSSSKDYNKHIKTNKHLGNTLATDGNQKNPKKEAIFKCDYCDNQYSDRSGLWKHKQKCIQKNTHNDTQHNNTNDNENNDLIHYLMNENKELKNIIIEVCKNIQPTNINNTINSNNKTFNLQVFLNETCKDAMNISDFVESIKLQVSDLENVGKVGYIEGISNIIIKNLQALDVEKRPVHCTDQKREVMYVKDENIWEKEDETNKKLRKAIRTIAHKNICMLKAFRDKYPDCEEYNSKKNSQYNKIVIEAMGGKGDDDFEKNSKIIKKIAKVVGIDKN